MEKFLENTIIFDHPLIAHKVTHLRDVHTGSKEFCELVNELTMLMGYEALRDMPTKNIMVQAPLRTFESPVLAEDFTIVPILRAGLGMVDGLRALSPTAKVVSLTPWWKTALQWTIYGSAALTGLFVILLIVSKVAGAKKED